MKSQPSRHTNPWRLKSKEQEAEEDCSCSSRADLPCSKNNTASSGPMFKACIRISQTSRQNPSSSLSASLLHSIWKDLTKIFANSQEILGNFSSFYTYFWRKRIVQEIDTSRKRNQNKCIITITADSVCIPAASIASTLFLLPLCKGKHLATKLRLTNTWNQYRPTQVYHQYKRIFCQETEAKKPT